MSDLPAAPALHVVFHLLKEKRSMQHTNFISRRQDWKEIKLLVPEETRRHRLDFSHSVFCFLGGFERSERLTVSV